MHRAAFLAFLLGIATAARAEDTTQVWITPSVTKAIDKSTSVEFDLSQRFRDEVDGGNLIQARLGIDHKIGSGFTAGLAIQGTRSNQNEFRVQEQLSFSHGILRIRSRLEQRFLENESRVAWRLRQRVGVQIPIDSSGWEVFANAERFWNLNGGRLHDPDSLTAVRLIGGVQKRLNPHLTLAVSYLNLRTIVHDGPNRTAHVPQFALEFDY